MSGRCGFQRGSPSAAPVKVRCFSEGPVPLLGKPQDMSRMVGQTKRAELGLYIPQYSSKDVFSILNFSFCYKKAFCRFRNDFCWELDADTLQAVAGW